MREKIYDCGKVKVAALEMKHFPIECLRQIFAAHGSDAAMMLYQCWHDDNVPLFGIHPKTTHIDLLLRAELIKLNPRTVWLHSPERDVTTTAS